MQFRALFLLRDSCQPLHQLLACFGTVIEFLRSSWSACGLQTTSLLLLCSQLFFFDVIPRWDQRRPTTVIGLLQMQRIFYSAQSWHSRRTWRIPWCSVRFQVDFFAVFILCWRLCGNPSVDCCCCCFQTSFAGVNLAFRRHAEVTKICTRRWRQSAASLTSTTRQRVAIALKLK